MSVWGIIFLGLLGVFFYVQAVTLFPDLRFSEAQEANLTTEYVNSYVSWLVTDVHSFISILLKYNSIFHTFSFGDKSVV